MRPLMLRLGVYAPPLRILQQSLVPLLALALVSFVPALASAAKSATGEWSATDVDSGTAVHMMLMPADTADFHSQVLWWRGRHVNSDQLDGGVRFWKPGTDSPSNPWSTSFTARRPIPIPGVDVFCSAADQLQDGRIFVVGGTEPEGGETGTAEARVFNPFTRAWESPYPAAMAARRWYPQVSTLWDGRMYVSSGSSHFNFFGYGGIPSGGSPIDRQVHRYQITGVGGLDPAVPPSHNPASHWPTALEGQTASDLRRANATVIFGGRRSDGSMADTTWNLSRSESDVAVDYQYAFDIQAITGPSGRSQHAAATIDDERLVMWGGREGSGVTTDNDIWIYERNQSAVLEWRRIQLDPEVGPAPRYGHGIMYDPAFNRVLMFGGATALGGAPSDSSVWAFTFDDEDRLDGTWSQPTTADSLSDGNPPALTEFGMVGDPVRRLWNCQSNQSGYDWNGILFGGRRSDGSASNELWILWSRSLGPDAGKVDWQKISLSNGPSARTRPGVGLDFSTGRFFVMGGDSAGTPLSDVHRVTVHREIAGTSCTREWVTLASLANAVKGHSVVLARSPSFSRVPEEFVNGQWISLTGAKRLQYWYPFNFTRPYLGNQLGTRIFQAGPHDTSRTTVVIDGSAFVQDSVVAATPLIGGSAVMYAPGKIMKCGTRDAPDDAGGVGGTATKRTQTIDVDATSPAWTEQTSQMNVPRVNHNLTLMPSGDVICLGGTKILNNSNATQPVRAPEIWSPSTASWGTPLDSTTLTRDYHNSALLLPDGRILAGGGNTCPGGPCLNDRTLDVFSPPYLYSGNDQRPRRQVLGADGILYPGIEFKVVTDSVAVDTVVLMRAGMVTHGFDTGQRIIRPTKETCSECGSESPPRSKFKLPTDPRELPPGSYQLFAIKNGVPSISRWVRVLIQGDSINGKNDVGDRSPSAKVTLSSSAAPCDEDYPALAWTAPGDDSSFFGAAKEFDIREGSSLCSGCWSQFSNATPLNDEPTPGAYGTSHSMNVPGLSPGYSYKFQMITKDDRSGRTSALSNVLTIHVLGCDGLNGGGGDEGGGMSARRAGVASAMMPHEQTSAGSPEVTLLPGTETEASRDLLPLAMGPRFTTGRAQVYLRRGATGRSSLTDVQLVAVDATAGEPFMTPARNPMTGVRAAALAVNRPDGSSVMDDLVSDETPYAGRPNDVLSVLLPSSSGPTPIVVRALGEQSPEIADYGIAVEVPDGAGWREVGRVTPRRQFTDIVVEGIDGNVARLVFKHPHAVSRIERLLPVVESASVHRPTFVAAHHTSLGAVEPAAFVAEGGVVVAARETLTVDFDALPEPAEGVSRTWYLEVAGRHEEVRSVTQADRAVPAPAPLRFALERPRPNPTAGRTTFEFAVPVSTPVRLEVFDLLGRHVATPHDAMVEPGQHVIEWNGTNASGARVRAGLYVCRMLAGPFRDEKKLLIVP